MKQEQSVGQKGRRRGWPEGRLKDLHVSSSTSLTFSQSLTIREHGFSHTKSRDS